MRGSKFFPGVHGFCLLQGCLFSVALQCFSVDLKPVSRNFQVGGPPPHPPTNPPLDLFTCCKKCDLILLHTINTISFFCCANSSHTVNTVKVRLYIATLYFWAMQVIKLIPSLAVKSKIPDILNQPAGHGSCDYILTPWLILYLYLNNYGYFPLSIAIYKRQVIVSNALVSLITDHIITSLGYDRCIFRVCIGYILITTLLQFLVGIVL